jgi:hypothetical protein
MNQTEIIDLHERDRTISMIISMSRGPGKEEFYKAVAIKIDAIMDQAHHIVTVRRHVRSQEHGSVEQRCLRQSR